MAVTRQAASSANVVSWISNASRPTRPASEPGKSAAFGIDAPPTSTGMTTALLFNAATISLET